MWIEMRAAAAVARLGTVTAAAEATGVHRATINRHIFALEKIFGAKLFLRHARGYTPTELGLDILRIANATEQQFEQLLVRAKGLSAELTGEFTITSIDVLAPLLMPLIRKFGEQHPELTVRFKSSQSVLQLEYGEAHVAFRLGPKTSEPDNVVKALTTLKMAMYASRDYVDRYGVPSSIDEFSNHRFVTAGREDIPAPFLTWLNSMTTESNRVFVGNEVSILNDAIVAGLGIGFLPAFVGSARSDLMEVLPSQSEWDVPIWIVTHVDLHRSAKVQAFLQIVRKERSLGALDSPN